MNNKILIGSIGATVILVLASFTTVVGFQSTDSSKINDENDGWNYCFFCMVEAEINGLCYPIYTLAPIPRAIVYFEGTIKKFTIQGLIEINSSRFFHRVELIGFGFWGYTKLSAGGGFHAPPTKVGGFILFCKYKID